MNDVTPPLLLDARIVDSLNMPPRRLSKFSLFWYLKSLPELTVGTIFTIFLIAIGSILSFVLIADWSIHRAFTPDQIQMAFDYDFTYIDEKTIQQWLEEPEVIDWIVSRPLWLLISPVVIAVLLVEGWLVVRALQWRRIRVGADHGILWMTGGLFTQWQRQLPIVHIQTVEFRSTPLQRALRLRGVSISSAAPEGKNATIDLLAVRTYIAQEFAETLRTAFGTTIATPETGVDDSTLVARVRWKQLIVAAANSFEVRMSVFSLYVVYRLLGHGQLKIWRDTVIHAATDYAKDHPGLAHFTLVAIGASLFFWIFSVAAFIATFAHFQLRRNGHLALVEHGLFTRRWRTILLPRVQALTFIESPVQQMMKSGSLRITLPGTTRNSVERAMLLPAVDRNLTIETLDNLFADQYPDSGKTLRSIGASLQRLPPSARRSYLLRIIVRIIPVSLLLGLIVGLVPGGFGPLWGFFPLVVFGPAGLLLGYIRYRDAGWKLDERGTFMVRERGLSRTTRITQRERLIWTRVSSIRFTSERNVLFQSSVAGAGARPNIIARMMGPHLIARGDSRFQIRGILRTDALELVDRLAKRYAPAPRSPHPETVPAPDTTPSEPPSVIANVRG